MAEFIGIGDLHLTSADGSGGLAKYIQNPNEMVMEELLTVLQWARKKGISKAIFYGDVCDSPRMSYEALIAFTKFLSENDDFMFYIILGNHDMYGETPETGHSLEVLQLLYSKKNVRFITKPRTLDIDGAKVRFLPYPFENFDKNALNVFHKEVYGSKGDSGRVMEGDDMSKSKAVVVAGHLHTAHRVRNTFYSGTLYQTNFGESQDKFFHHIDFHSPSEYSIELVPHKPKYVLHNVVLQSRADLATIPTGETNLVKLVVQDGADVTAADYANRPNIAVVKNFKSKDDLHAVLTEDLTEGKQLVVRTEDFFRAWIDSLDVESAMRKRVRQVRRRVLEAVPSKMERV
jgi:DNA repair exonuclease SbcCD nuclease subunit